MTTEMHSAGEPLRIVEQGARGCQLSIDGQTLLEKRRYVRENLDGLRKFLMWEPRGHHDMYGALLVEPDHPGNHHNYSRIEKSRAITPISQNSLHFWPIVEF